VRGPTTEQTMKQTTSVLSAAHRLVQWFVLSTALVAIALAASVNAAIVPPDQIFASKTYAEWTAASWIWTLEIPWDSHHPIRDQTGADALRNQSGQVWYIGFGATTSNAVTRSIRVPDDKALFVSLDGVECSTVEQPPFNGRDEAELRACVRSFDPAAPSCEIDGEPVPSLERFEFISPLFDFNLPVNNGSGVHGGGPGQGVARGTSVMVHSLPLGLHTIHFRGGYPDENVSWDVTYRITVFTPPSLAIRPLPGTNLIELSWPLTSGFSLQQADSLDVAATWTAPSVVSTSLTNGVQFATVTNAPGHRFFRLSQP